MTRAEGNKFELEDFLPEIGLGAVAAAGAGIADYVISYVPLDDKYHHTKQQIAAYESQAKSLTFANSYLSGERINTSAISLSLLHQAKIDEDNVVTLIAHEPNQGLAQAEVIGTAIGAGLTTAVACLVIRYLLYRARNTSHQSPLPPQPPSKGAGVLNSISDQHSKLRARGAFRDYGGPPDAA